MCGRIACNQCREVYQKATCYYDDKSAKYVLPDWKEVSSNGKEFKPSCNISPTQVTPVLLSGELVTDVSTRRALQPMMWGVIPPWHKGNPNSHGLSTNNCRIENIGTSKLYGPLLKEGRRCVIICDGFYEWQTTLKAKTKQPYFIYSAQDKENIVEDQMSWLQAEWSSSSGWKGPKLLCMAGLFNVWKPDQGDEIYNYTVITKESSKNFSWLHHRVPAFLSSTHQVENWLDSKTVNMYEALKVLLSPDEMALSWHPVSTIVNKSTNQSSECNKRIHIKKETLLTSWLKQPGKRESEPDGCKSDYLKKRREEEDKPT